MTALNQSPARTDVELTRLIRQDLMRHSELSSNAHNIKVITVNGVVTLKGPVKNLQEMKIVDEIARGEAGVRNAINEMQTTSAE
jgi:osmotically-inducible protein OsmY